MIWENCCIAISWFSKDITVEFVAKDFENLVSFDPDSWKVSSLFFHVVFVKSLAIQRERRAEHCFPAAIMPFELLFRVGRYLTCFEK